MKIDQFQGNSNCEKSMKARTNLRPSMESLLPGLQFEKKLSKLVEIWFTSDENARANFFLGHPVLFCLCGQTSAEREITVLLYSVFYHKTITFEQV